MNGQISKSWLLLVLLACAGCGSGRYPVHGRVTYEDGQPVPAGIVMAEATIEKEPVSVQGNIEQDGMFQWGADTPGDGALPGSYRVIIMPLTPSDLELSQGKKPDVPGKYGSYESSGITFEVKPQDNVLDITVSRPK